jgi:LacI family transcriptional regulator
VRITIADVAARAGVSKTTVSRVLNAKDDVDRLTAERVRKVIDELGYVPSSGAVGLARGKTRVVGVLVPSLQWPWMGDVLQGAVDTIEARSYGVLLFTCNRGDSSMRQFAAQVSAKSFDGLVVMEPEGTLDFIAGLHSDGLPVVMIDDRGHQPQFPSVGTTNREGAYAAAEHLLANGRRRPVVIQGHEWFGCTRERLAGFSEAFVEAGHPVDPDLVMDGEFTFEGGRRAIERLLSTGAEFDAVFAHNDLSAGGAMVALRNAGIGIPDDVAVVGFDDIPYASNTDPALTTVRQPMHEMGAAAARMLLDRVDGATKSNARKVIPTSLVVRQSSVAVGRRALLDGRGGDFDGPRGVVPTDGPVPLQRTVVGGSVASATSPTTLSGRARRRPDAGRAGS